MFPESTKIGILLNEFYGLMLKDDVDNAFNNFLIRNNTLSLKNEVININNVALTKRFILQKDFWGSKEVLLIQKGADGYDYMLSYSTRNPSDYYPVAEFVSKSERIFELQEDTLNQGLFRLRYPGLKFNISDSMIALKKNHNQLYEVAAFIVK